MVMEGVGTPSLIVQPGASPHGYSMRPSEAKALDKAAIVFWIGEDLEPWLKNSIQALASDANVIELAEVEGTTTLEFRESVIFEGHDHDDHDDHENDEAGHDDHDEHQDHTGHDPHSWLDPENGRVWLDAIAAELSEHDPDNAATYMANAEKGKADLASLIAEVSAQLDPVRGANFVVFHDAYQYFENRFDFRAAGAITLVDASDPSPARIEEIHHKVEELGITCVFAEPQYDRNLVRTVFQGTSATTGVMDPLGVDLKMGADLYPQLLRNLAGSLVDCLE
jgi:zinc transport system substrate-binding protein